MPHRQLLTNRKPCSWSRQVSVCVCHHNRLAGTQRAENRLSALSDCHRLKLTGCLIWQLKCGHPDRLMDVKHVLKNSLIQVKFRGIKGIIVQLKKTLRGEHLQKWRDFNVGFFKILILKQKIKTVFKTRCFNLHVQKGVAGGINLKHLFNQASFIYTIKKGLHLYVVLSVPSD